MATQTCSTYSINGNVVTLTGVNQPLSNILAISDVSRGQVLYSWVKGGQSNYTQAENSTITLINAPTSNAALLRIVYDDGTGSGSGAITSVDLGTKADSVATTNTGTFSLVALFKFLLGKVDSIISGLSTLHSDLSSQSSSLSTLTTAVNAVTTAVGAVQTAATAINTTLGTTNSDEATLISQTSTLSSALSSLASLLSTGNAALATLHADEVTLDGLVTTGNTALAAIQTATAAGATSAQQTTAQTSLSALVSAAGTTNTTLSTIAGNITTLGTTLGGGATLQQIVTALNPLATSSNISSLQTALSTYEASEATSLTAIATATGTQSDTAWTTGNGSLIALVKAIAAKILGTVSVSGTFWQTTQPVSLASVPTHGVTSTDLGTTSDTSASSDTGTFSLLALVKRGLATLTTIAGNFSALATSAKQDTANTNLSQLHTDLIAATPAGSNVIGGVTIADGSNSSQGAKADSAANNSTSSWSIVALLKGIYALCAASTPAGSNLIGGVNVQQGGNTLAVDASGAVTAHNAPSSTQSYTFTGAIALNAVVIAQVDCAQYRTARTHITSLGAGGVLQIQASNDGSNWTFINTCVENGASQIYQSNISATGAYVTALSGARYMRVIASTAYTSGTTSLTVQFSEQVAVNPFQNVYVQNSFPVFLQQSSSYGFGSYHTLVAAGSTNATSVRATTCTMGSCYLANTSAAFRYVKFYNKAGAPSVGTDTPSLQFALPPNSAMNVETSFAGMRFTSGLSYCITAGSALLDTTAVTAGDVLVNLSYV